MQLTEQEARPLLAAGLRAMSGNPCWQWLRRQMAERDTYLSQRLRQAASWEEHCRLAGQLEAVSQLLDQVRQLERLNTEGGNDDDLC